MFCQKFFHTICQLSAVRSVATAESCAYAPSFFPEKEREKNTVQIASGHYSSHCGAQKRHRYTSGCTAFTYNFPSYQSFEPKTRLPEFSVLLLSKSILFLFYFCCSSYFDCDSRSSIVPFSLPSPSSRSQCSHVQHFMRQFAVSANRSIRRGNCETENIEMGSKKGGDGVCDVFYSTTTCGIRTWDASCVLTVVVMIRRATCHEGRGRGFP